VSVELLIALAKLLKVLLSAFKRLSTGAQLLILGGIAALLAHPKSRAKLKELWGILEVTCTPRTAHNGIRFSYSEGGAEYVEEQAQ